MKIKILRIVEEHRLVSADTFELNLKKFSQNKFQIDYTSPQEMNNILLECYNNINKQRFFDIAMNYDFFSFGFGSFLSIPIFLRVRNEYNIDTRLLFISHAPGKHVFEFYLMQNLLRSGDIIIAPTNSAANVIKYICPAIKPFIKIIFHPVESVNHSEVKPKKNIFVTFTRIHPDKMLHKIIDAVKILKSKGKNVTLIIAGNLLNENRVITTYARILKNKIKKLNLIKDIRFIGEIRDLSEKENYMKSANALINLSVSLEESFGKSIVEAISVGTPVIVSNWDGLIETAGDCGLFVPVILKDGFPDICASHVADAMEIMIKNSSDFREKCKSQAKKFKIENIEKQYYQGLSNPTLDNSGEINKDKGLINRLSLINIFDYVRLFKEYIEYFKKNIVNKSNKETIGSIIHQIMVFSVSKPLRYFLAGHTFEDKIFSAIPSFDLINSDDFYYNLINSVFSFSSQYSKELSLFFALGKVDTEYYNKVLAAVEPYFENKRNINFLKIEIEILKKDYEAAAMLWEKFFSEREFKEHDYILIRQISKIYRKLRTPERAIYFIKKWLKDYDFSPYSLPIWSDLCFNAIEAGKDYHKDAETAFEKIKNFSEDREIIEKFYSKLIKRNYNG